MLYQGMPTVMYPKVAASPASLFHAPSGDGYLLRSANAPCRPIAVTEERLPSLRHENRESLKLHVHVGL